MVWRNIGVPAHALVDQRQQVVDFAPFFRHDLHVERAGEIQRLDLIPPDEEQAVVAPAAGQFNKQFLVARAVAQPLVLADEFFHQVDRIA